MTCQKCKSEFVPHEVDIPFVGRRVFQVCRCPDDRPTMEESQQEAYLSACHIPDETLEWVNKGIPPDEENNEGLEVAREYCRNLEDNVKQGRGLLYLGTTGTMKTVILSSVLKYACTHFVTSRWIGYRKIVKIVTDPSYREDMAEELDRIARYRLILIDDLACEPLATWQKVNVSYLIDQRFKRKMPTLYTANCDDKELTERIGADIFSRIAGTCQIVMMTGRDRRIK